MTLPAALELQDRIVFIRHQRHSRNDSRPGLAHGDDMRLRTKRAQHAHDVIDVIVEIEAAGDHRHRARIGPIGDVDFMVRQECVHGVAQQRRVVARHRRHDEH